MSGAEILYCERCGFTTARPLERCPRDRMQLVLAGRSSTVAETPKPRGKSKPTKTKRTRTKPRKRKDQDSCPD